MLQKLEGGGGWPERHSSQRRGTALRRVSFGLLTRSRNSWQLRAAAGNSPCAHYRGSALTAAGPEAELPHPHLVLCLWPSAPKWQNHSSPALSKWEEPNSGTSWKARHLAWQGCMARPTAHTPPGKQAVSRWIGPEAWNYLLCSEESTLGAYVCTTAERTQSLTMEGH